MFTVIKDHDREIISYYGVPIMWRIGMSVYCRYRGAYYSTALFSSNEDSTIATLYNMLSFRHDVSQRGLFMRNLLDNFGRSIFYTEMDT